MKTKRFVAVIVPTYENFNNTSGRPDGDWASFLDSTPGKAAGKAYAAIARWKAESSYRVVVGQVTHKAKLAVNLRKV